MRSSTARVATLARHEYRSALRSRVLVALVAVMLAATLISVYVSTAAFRSQMADYLAYQAAARASGILRIAPPPLDVLSLLRGAFEYIEIVGAVFAIALGYLSISRERAGRTGQLLLSRPVTTGELSLGSIVGALGAIATLLAAIGLASVICLGTIGHDWLNATQAVKVALALIAAAAYLVMFYCLGAALTARSKVPTNGLMVALGLWLLVVLVMPQLGDTLDPDNQLPGGLFAALTLDPGQQAQVQAHLGIYEHIRTTIESLSVEKHFERFAFAMIDIKANRRGYSISRLLHITRTDVAWVTAWAAAMIALLRYTFRPRRLT